MVVTSHKCLVILGEKVRACDVLNLPMTNSNPRSIANSQEITLTDTRDITKANHTFKVLEMYCNPQFAMSSERNEYPENDLILLKVNGSFTSHPKFLPICIPGYAKDLELTDLGGYYYTHHLRKIDNDPVDVHEGNFYKIEKCYEYLHLKDSKESELVAFNKTICFTFDVIEHELVSI